MSRVRHVALVGIAGVCTALPRPAQCQNRPGDVLLRIGTDFGEQHETFRRRFAASGELWIAYHSPGPERGRDWVVLRPDREEAVRWRLPEDFWFQDAARDRLLGSGTTEAGEPILVVLER